MKKLIAVLAVVALLGATTAAHSESRWVRTNAPTTVHQKQVKKLTDHIKVLQKSLKAEKQRADNLEAVMGKSILEQVPTFGAETLWVLTEAIGARIAYFSGYHVGVEESIDDAGQYRTWTITQARYFLELL